MLLREAVALLFAAVGAQAATPVPPGKLISVGDHRLHLFCAGAGTPTVVIENGLGDFSFQWTLVQSRVARFTRICTYDRAGYAWSDPGPKPRTFAQINLELHDTLAAAGERAPYILVGHSYGGPVVRNFALTYPRDVAGIVFVDAAHEGLRVNIGGGKTIRLGENAKGAPIPTPHEQIAASDKPTIPQDLPRELRILDRMFGVLPAHAQAWQLWAQQQPAVYDAQNSETQWSEEYFAKWLATPQAGTLGAIPIVVLSQADGEKERTQGQKILLSLCANSKQVFVHAGHNMHLEAPHDVAAAIQSVWDGVRSDAGSGASR
ncbi:MAG TPA: alpha/beta hydrolase [Bryobacteraceae bacterium]|nr:alpha/beta hydrolase [Bryobacteraceae bacterium]